MESVASDRTRGNELGAHCVGDVNDVTRESTLGHRDFPEIYRDCPFTWLKAGGGGGDGRFRRAGVNAPASILSRKGEEWKRVSLALVCFVSFFFVFFLSTRESSWKLTKSVDTRAGI